MSNLNTWKQQHIVAEYAAATELQPPEKAILDRLGEQLPRMKMLDIGVGGGRTTIHFAAAAEEYWGIDYSEEMIAACRNRFQNGSSSIRFAVCDAKAMNICPDRFFSFILFSFSTESITYRTKTVYECSKKCKESARRADSFAFQLTTLRGCIISSLKPSSPAEYQRRPKKHFRMAAAQILLQ